jgi:deferrochelatase/peroxidase EfeB
MSEIILASPLPLLGGPFQPGITDPVWPAETPNGVDDTVYQERYAGQLERQRHLHVVTADVTVRTREELLDLLKRLTRFTSHQMEKPPAHDYQRGYDLTVRSRRVSITIGFGATLFTTHQGDDRFGLAALRPNGLKVMPTSEGDAEGFRPRDYATDLVVLVASDDTYVNEYIFGRLYYGRVHPGLVVRRVERGYARPDTREPSGFEDGLSNPRELPTDNPMHRVVYVREHDEEPTWCRDGTYLGYRKIRRRMARFFELSDSEREAVFGVERTSGLRLAAANSRAHAPKMNPRREHPDLFGIMDHERRMLRRPYFFNDGLDSQGEEVRGLHHLSFARDLAKQYEWPVQMWQMNRNFPTPGTGLDPLYGIGGAANVGGGYYFMPAAPVGADDWIGSGLWGRMTPRDGG